MNIFRDFILTLLTVLLLFVGIFLFAEWNDKTVESAEFYPFSPGDRTWILEVKYKERGPVSFFLNRNVRLLISPDDADNWFENYQENKKLQCSA